MEPAFRSKWAVWTILVVAVAMSLTFVGCNDLSETTTIPEVTTTEAGTSTTAEPEDTTTTEAPAGPATTIKVDASEDLLSNGHIRACGIITEVWTDGGTRKMKIDYVDFLTGAQADAAAVADGFIAPGEHVDNDYYVRNNNTKLRTFTVSDSVVITTYSRVAPIDVADPACSWTEFYNFWNLVGPPVPSDVGLSDGLWWIERDSSTDEVVSIEQQWVP